MGSPLVLLIVRVDVGGAIVLRYDLTIRRLEECSGLLDLRGI